MTMNTLLFAVVCVAAVVSSTLAVTPISLNAYRRRAFLEAHNSVRKPLGLPPLTWDYKLASFARDHAAKCVWAHSNGPYGENLSYSYPKKTDHYFNLAKSHVKLWEDEKELYLAAKDWSCMTNGCGHYSQMVWKNSLRVGCAIAHCPSLPNFTVCEYDPPGNYLGQTPY